MDFWIVNFDDGGAIGVDNDGVQPVDVTPLPLNVNYFHWKKDGGEIYYSDRMSLPDRISDPTPYLWIIDQFLTLAQLNDQPINLTQAQTVKSNTADAIFHAKRQLPISAYGYSWNAMDDEVLAMNTAIGATASSIPWYPIGATTPVNLTITEMSSILAAIVTRRLNLDAHRRAVKAAINACMTIAQVIAIDLTTGWPTA